MIIVFGSVNMDLVTRVEAIARPGETVLAANYATIPGGKGANQALAARRAGAPVRLVAAVGRDEFADAALVLLAGDGVDLRGVAHVGAPTGLAFISVDAHGQNAITVASGANAHATAAQIGEMAAGDILLLQREVPDVEGQAAARLAKASGARTILNLAPAGNISRDYLAHVDVLIVNQHEAETLARQFGGDATAPEAIAAWLQNELGLSVITTLGAAGAIGCHLGRTYGFVAPQVNVIDTTAAGDGFIGAFAAAWHDGADFALCLQQGLVAGSLACTKPGAQPSLPYSSAIAEALAGALAAFGQSVSAPVNRATGLNELYESS